MSDLKINNPWILQPKLSHSTSLNLICFPPGGCGASIFNSWSKYLPSGLAISAVQLPGRETRFKEVAFSNMALLISELLISLLPYVKNVPFAVFGHSVGALIAFEFVRQLHQNHLPSPEYLIVSGRRAPHIPLDKILHLQADSALIEELRLIGGTSDLILDDPELMSLFLPIVRADFTINETYQVFNEFSVNCPILAMGGYDDPLVNQDFLEQWRQYTTGEFEAVMLSGGHMTFKENPQPLLDVVVRKLVKNI
ncbi:thioesterase II family protein [Pseudanabaena sp. ABRG5-3]|uniref:thioesterase II family protein n=1 Tax=Pseudanabaena sp. ABRG5-3 TaxID=685565 RepID=UPI000DC74168|nr:thioesterase domain-containing protein [Pseudanabaena sp. ABRG5-3]BBC27204.1 thioesterase [Pseudanabaena sp. ABRG5-3]